MFTRRAFLSAAVVSVSMLVVACNGGDGGNGASSGGGQGGGTGSSATSPWIGTWTGTWTNATFGSSGPLTVTISDNGNGTVNVTVDLGGMVGGMLDPPPQTVTATVSANGTVSFSGNVNLLGALSFTIANSGAVSISAPNIAVAGFSSFTASGNLSGNSGSLTYTVNFTPAGGASGTVSVTRS